MKICEQILIEVEKIRQEVSDTWGKLLCQSGAIVLKKPSFLSCLIGILFQGSRDIGLGIDKIIKFKNESPFIEVGTFKFSENEPLIGDTSNIQSTKDFIVYFAKSVDNLTPNAITLKNSIETALHEISDLTPTWVEDFKEKADNFKGL